MSEWKQLATEIRRGVRGCDVVIEALAKQSVTTLFGLPAESINSLFDAARKRTDLSVITSRHESNAALMASAYGKLLGTPAAVTATNGPGVTHLPIGTRDALLDGAPLIALCGAAPHDLAGTESFQGVDGQLLLDKTTITSAGVWTTSALKRLNGIMMLAKTTAAPVSVSIGQDVLTSAASRLQHRKVELPAEWSSSDESVKQAQLLYAAAKRIIIVAGDLRDAPDGLVEYIIEASTNQPVLAAPSSMHSPGWTQIPINSRLTDGNQDAWNQLANADLIVVIGGWPGEVLDGLAVPMIQLCKTPKTYNGSISRCMLLGPSWKDLLPAQLPSEEPRQYIGSGNSVNTQIMDMLDELIPPDALVAMEPGLISDMLFCGLPERSRRFTGSFSAKTHGYAIPAAIGGRMALPDRPSFAIVDAYGWKHGNIEILTSIKHELGINVVAVGSPTELETIREQASALGMKMPGEKPGSSPSNILYSIEGLYPRNFEDNRFSSSTTTVVGRTMVDFITMDSLQKHRQEFTFPETGSLYAAGLAKSSPRCPILIATDEQSLLREYNGLFDCAFDHAGIVLMTSVDEDSAIGNSCWKLGMPEDHLKALPHLTMRNAKFIETSLGAAIELAERHKCVVHLSCGYNPDRQRSDIRIGARQSDVAHCSQQIIHEVAASLRTSESTVIVCGRGAAGASETIVKLADRIDATIVATMGGGTGIDMTARFCGYVGTSGHQNAQDAVKNADLVLVLGVSNRGGAFETIGQNMVIDINNDPFTLANRRFKGRAIVASIENFATRVVTHLNETAHYAIYQPRAKSRRAERKTYPEAQTAWWQRVITRSYCSAAALRPSHIIRMLDDKLTSDYQVHVVGDVGLNTLWMYRFKRSHANTIWTQNFATMGFALPAAVGASLDGTPSIAVIGDGGMVMALPGLENLRLGDPPVLVIVIDNEGLGAIRYEQEISGWPEFESSLINGDLAAYAASVGWIGHRIVHPGEFQKALSEFLNEPKPTLLHILCTQDEPPVPASLPSLPRTVSMMYSWVRQGRRGWQSARSTIKAVIGR